MIDKSSLLKSQDSLYLEFIPKDGLFHKMLQLSLMGFLTGWCNLLGSYCRVFQKYPGFAVSRATRGRLYIIGISTSFDFDTISPKSKISIKYNIGVF